MGDSKVFTLGACHSVLADKHPLLQEAFPNPPLFPACFRMASWAAVGPCPLSGRGSSVRRARWLTVPDSCWMGCIRDGQTDLEGGLYPAPPHFGPGQTKQEPCSFWTPRDAQPHCRMGGPGEREVVRAVAERGRGCLGKRIVPRPPLSGQLTQTRETDLSGRPEGWKEQEGCTREGFS